MDDLWMRRSNLKTKLMLLAGIGWAGCLPACDRQPELSNTTLTVFAASSLTDVGESLAREFTRESGIEVRISSAGSSVLARQIEGGAGADVFLSADPDWVRYLDERNVLAEGEPLTFASNELVFIALETNSLDVEIDPGFDFASSFGGRLAIADPDHVPAGRYARRALESLGWWADVADRLAPSLDVRSALAFVERGEAELGIVYRSDVRAASGVRIVATLPQSLTGPVRYVACQPRSARAEADAFVQWLITARAQSVLRAAGFDPIRSDP